MVRHMLGSKAWSSVITQELEKSLASLELAVRDDCIDGDSSLFELMLRLPVS